MPDRKPDDAQIVSVRLPRDLIQRLDRYLDWQNLHRKRNPHVTPRSDKP